MLIPVSETNWGHIIEKLNTNDDYRKKFMSTIPQDYKFVDIIVTLVRVSHGVELNSFDKKCFRSIKNTEIVKSYKLQTLKKMFQIVLKDFILLIQFLIIF